MAIHSQLSRMACFMCRPAAWRQRWTKTIISNQSKQSSCLMPSPSENRLKPHSDAQYATRPWKFADTTRRGHCMLQTDDMPMSTITIVGNPLGHTVLDATADTGGVMAAVACTRARAIRPAGETPAQGMRGRAVGRSLRSTRIRSPIMVRFWQGCFGWCDRRLRGGNEVLTILHWGCAGNNPGLSPPAFLIRITFHKSRTLHEWTPRFVAIQKNIKGK